MYIKVYVTYIIYNIFILNIHTGDSRPGILNKKSKKVEHAPTHYKKIFTKSSGKNEADFGAETDRFFQISLKCMRHTDQNILVTRLMWYTSIRYTIVVVYHNT